MTEIRIALGIKDFRELVEGEEIVKENERVKVRIILNDIGYHIMREFLDEKCSELKEKNGNEMLESRENVSERDMKAGLINSLGKRAE